jgi:hypothetical protein
MQESDYEVSGEVIKLIHGELPAVRWTCGSCGEDSCTIFFQPEEQKMIVECESCNATNLVRRDNA